MTNTRLKLGTPATLLVLFYCTAVIWASFCIPTGDSHHARHKDHPAQKASSGHSIACQLACSGGGSASSLTHQPLSAPRLILAALLSISFFSLYHQFRLSRQNTRAPPLFS